MRPYSKNITKAKWARGVIQVSECLSGKLNSHQKERGRGREGRKEWGGRGERGGRGRRKEGRREKEGKKQAVVVHTCNPSYSRGKDQEDCGLKPARENSSWDPILKKPITYKDW
jgi:hypothetical protein